MRIQKFFGRYIKHKNLILNLVSSELKLKYKSSILGFFWTLLEPLFIIVVLLFVFSNLFKSDIPNYPAYLIIGFVAWGFFSNGTSILDILVSKADLIKKIHFPRELLIICACIINFIDSIFEFLILIIILFLFMGINISLSLLYIPLIMLIQFFFIVGFSLLLSSLYVFFRDVKHIWNVLLQIGFFATPIIYPSSILIGKLSFMLILNPMAHFINIYRSVIIYGKIPALNGVLILCLFSITIIFVGWAVFKKLEPKFGEEV